MDNEGSSCEYSKPCHQTKLDTEVLQQENTFCRRENVFVLYYGCDFVVAVNLAERGNTLMESTNLTIVVSLVQSH